MASAVLKARQTLRIGLGLLWVIDALLQLQPGMFTMDMISDIMQPAATGEPAWLKSLIDWSITTVTPHLVLFNWAIVALQLAIGILILYPRRTTVRLGLLLSVVWGVAVWIFGEALGQLLTGSTTFLAGAPGSVAVYMVAALLLLLPGQRWSVGWLGRHNPATVVVGGIMLLAIGLQANPLFWTSLGAANVFAQGAQMGGPWPLSSSLAAAATVAGGSPVLINLVLIAAMSLVVVVLAWSPSSVATLLIGLGLLALTWWFGQDAGGLFSGMATDPNTAPVLGLLFAAGWLAGRDKSRAVATRNLSQMESSA